MRPLTESEAKTFFERLTQYIGRNAELLLKKRNGANHCFRLHRNRVYYVREDISKKAVNIPRTELLILGICFGKFTKSMKFHMSITAMPYLSMYAQYKVWIKKASQFSFLYGKHVLKAGLGRITEDTPQNQRVVVYSMEGMPLGLGVTTKTAQ